MNTFNDYYNQYRVHALLGGSTPDDSGVVSREKQAKLHNFAWKSYCNNVLQTLFQPELPIRHAQEFHLGDADGRRDLGRSLKVALAGASFHTVN